MESLIKINLDEIISSDESLAIEIGCGRRKKQGRVGIDCVDLPGVDIVADIEKGLSFLPDGVVDEIHCRNVLEHVDSFEHLMKEFIRVLKSDGRAHISVPHFSNPYFYSDYTHVRPFGLYTFYYFVDEKYQLRRKVPDFYSDIRIKVLSLKLKFRSSSKLLNPLSKLWGRLVNLHSLSQEYYEGNLCYLIPCHGIEIVFKPDKNLSL